jgi:hypothetical protein
MNIYFEIAKRMFLNFQIASFFFSVINNRVFIPNRYYGKIEQTQGAISTTTKLQQREGEDNTYLNDNRQKAQRTTQPTSPEINYQNKSKRKKLTTQQGT